MSVVGWIMLYCATSFPSQPNTQYGIWEDKRNACVQKGLQCVEKVSRDYPGHVTDHRVAACMIGSKP
jgi:hypothetical protein